MVCQVERFVAPILSYSGDQFEHRVFCSVRLGHIVLRSARQRRAKGERREAVLKAAADEVLTAMRY